MKLWGVRLLLGLFAIGLALGIMFFPTGIVIEAPAEEVPFFERQQPVIAEPRHPTDPVMVVPTGSYRVERSVIGYNWRAFRGTLSNYFGKLSRGEFYYETPMWRGMATEPVMERTDYGNDLVKGAKLSLKVIAVSLLLGTLGGVLLGALSLASRLFRKVAISIAVTGLSLPDFCLVMVGQLLAIWFYRNWGFRPWSVGVPDSPGQEILPMVALSIPVAAYIARLTLTGLDDVMHEDYIRTARSKGVHELKVILGHAFRNALPRIMNGMPTVMNVTLSSLVVVELLTSMTGLGRLIGRFGLEQTASAVIIFCVWFTVLDGFAHTLRILSNPLLREGSK